MKRTRKNSITFQQAYEKIDQLPKNHLEILIFKWMVGNKVSFIDINKLYVKYLENVGDKQKHELANVANTLATTYSVKDLNKNNSLKNFNDARAKILLQPWQDIEWLEKTFKHVSKKDLADAARILGRE